MTQTLDTVEQYSNVIRQTKELFIKKAIDYGTAWRILRDISIFDQLFIKANRIRTLQNIKVNNVGESIESEFVGLVNYGIIGLILMDKNHIISDYTDIESLEHLYDRIIQSCMQTMKAKNADYGEAWREMSQESLVDLILMKIMRSKQIIQNNYRTVASENIDANFIDIINYAVFALIL